MPIEVFPNAGDRSSQIEPGVSMHDASNAIDRLRAAAGIRDRADQRAAMLIQSGGKGMPFAGPGGVAPSAKELPPNPPPRAQLNLVELALNKIARDEFGDGTAANPGAHTTRASLRQMLQSGRSASGRALSTGQRRLIAARLNQLTDSLQRMQERKAQLQGKAVPPQEMLPMLDEGEGAFSPNGEEWTKRDGVLYRSE
jgi:hypothetical protein